LPHSRTALLVALLSFASASVGCVCPPWVCGWGEVDRVWGDEDVRGDREGGDVEEEPSSVLDAITFALTFEAERKRHGDRWGDDDDSADSVQLVELRGTLVSRYWANYDDRELLCEQHVSFEGEARHEGAPDCEVCTGFIQLRASSVVDVSNPLVDPDHCDPARVEALGLDFGRRLLTPAGVGGLGDFLSIALVDAETGLEEELEFAAGDELSYEGQAEALAAEGAVLTHGGYLRATPEGLVDGAGIDQVAGTPDESSEWFAFFRLFRMDGSNTNEEPILDGLYAAQSVWVVFPR